MPKTRSLKTIKVIEFRARGDRLGSAIKLVLSRDTHEVSYGMAENPVVKFYGLTNHSNRILEVYIDLDEKNVNSGYLWNSDDSDERMPGLFRADLGNGSIDFAQEILREFFASHGSKGGLDMTMVSFALRTGDLRITLGDERARSFEAKDLEDWETLVKVAQEPVFKCNLIDGKRCIIDGSVCREDGSYARDDCTYAVDLQE